MRNPIDTISIIAWNIYVGTGVEAARRSLKEFREKIGPDMFALMEATNLYGDLDKLGYDVVQLKPRALRKGNRTGQGNIAILVDRDKLEIKRRGALHMLTFWRGPKHGWAQDPRVYRWVLVRRHGAKKWFKVGVAHTPFGEAARAESRWKLMQFLKNVMPGRPTVLVLDANMRLPEFREKIAQPGGASATGEGIDLEAHKNCWLRDSENLGRGVSDHPAKYYEYVAGKRNAA